MIIYAEKPRLSDLIREVRTTQWYRFGLELTNDDVASMDIIGVYNRDMQEALRATFKHWLAVCEHPTWQTVITALRKIEENHLALELEQK